MPRLFTGIELPSQLRQDLARLALPVAGAKWAEPENLHLTLRYAGDIDNPNSKKPSACFQDLLPSCSCLTPPPWRQKTRPPILPG